VDRVQRNCRRFSNVDLACVLTRRESVTNRQRSATIGHGRRSAGGGNDLSVRGGGGGGGVGETGGLLGPPRHHR